MLNKNIEVQGVRIHFSMVKDKDYVSLTDIAKQSDRNEAKYLIRNWMKNNSTLEFLTAWEGLFNPDFIKGVHLDPLLRDFRKNLEWHISKITDNVEEIRNLLDTIPGQNPQRNRLRYLEE